jgi:hypothetical protein
MFTNTTRAEAPRGSARERRVASPVGITGRVYGKPRAASLACRRGLLRSHHRAGGVLAGAVDA